MNIRAEPLNDDQAEEEFVENFDGTQMNEQGLSFDELTLSFRELQERYLAKEEELKQLNATLEASQAKIVAKSTTKMIIKEFNDEDSYDKGQANWTTYKKRFLAELSHLRVETEQEKLLRLDTYGGSKLQQIRESWTGGSAPLSETGQLLVFQHELGKIDAYYCRDASTLAALQQELFEIVPKAGERIMEFFLRASKIAVDCGLPDDERHSSIKSIIVRAGNKHHKFVDFNRMGNRSTDEMLKFLQSIEREELSKVSKVYKVNEDEEAKPEDALVRANFKRNWNQQQEQQSTGQQSRFKRFRSDVAQCYKCGLMHDQGNCRAANVDCRRCGKRGHYARVCNQLMTGSGPSYAKFTQPMRQFGAKDEQQKSNNIRSVEEVDAKD
jgi:hypothetical protein